MIIINLYELFDLCLNAEYTTVENSADYAIFEKEGTLYISFQCSNGATDWKNNLDFPAKVYKDMDRTWFCHRGFLRVWKSIEPYIKNKIITTGCQKIVVVGYSHGAAIATLAHEYVWYWRNDLKNNIVGYGFGCPRCFFGPYIPSKLKARWKNFHPVRNIDDIVTHLPPRLLGYKHVNKVIEIGEKGKYNKVDAHRPENYLNELKNVKIEV